MKNSGNANNKQSGINNVKNAQKTSNTKNCGRGGKCSGNNNTKDCK
ncbi:MAG: hypothetical protein HFE27_01725 [Clostridia bacterium]|jgi:hypothetical protein|nr:hypothetical protein [Clostridia bacterium]